MGIQVDRERFVPADYTRFEARLARNLEALRRLLARPDFGRGELTLGAEVEVSVVDAEHRALHLNRDLLARALDPRLQLELDRFNLEYNLTPVPARGRPFSRLADELRGALSSLNALADPLGGRVATIGILPTLTAADLGTAAMTDLPRYRALSAGLRGLRRAPFDLHFQGRDELHLQADDVTMEGAATSFQLHVRVEPERFAAFHNALQLVTAPVLAVSTNSPFFLGKRLWEETRVALFKQAVDSRGLDHGADPMPPPRVSFGNGWVRHGAYELLAEVAAVFPPLLPLLGEQDPLQCLDEGRIPRLDELRLHAGTVWRWNRAVFDDAAGGHLRVEARALPSGPTPRDMLASGALLVGAARALMDDIEARIAPMPFGYAAWNFYRAAQVGLDANLVWPEAGGLRRRGAASVVEALLPAAERGLTELGVDAGEIASMLGIVEGRLARRQTGARWQLAHHERLRASLAPGPALQGLLRDYLEHSRSGEPVHGWPP